MISVPYREKSTIVHSFCYLFIIIGSNSSSILILILLSYLVRSYRRANRSVGLRALRINPYKADPCLP